MDLVPLGVTAPSRRAISYLIKEGFALYTGSVAKSV